MAYYWKGMFPDGSGIIATIPAVQATLYLADPVTVSGALDLVIIRARAEGTAGNGVQFRMVVGTLSDSGELVEDTSTGQVTVKFNDGDRVGDIISLINIQSTLVEAVGSWNPSDILIDGEDDFAYLDLEHGVDAISGIRAGYWGPHYPDWASSPVTFRPGNGPPGVATFALLEGAATVHFVYQTDIFKSYDGRERRAALYDDPAQSFGGNAYLVGENAVNIRTQLARFAALGSVFQLALPYEELTIVDDSDSLTVPVVSTAASDWANVGQRVVVVDRDGNSVAGVIQTVNATSLELDVVPGAIGQAGSRIMPTVPVALEPAQGFSRYPVARSVTALGARQVESWTIAARGVTAGFEVAAQVGILALAPLVATAALAGIILRGVTTGVDIQLSFEANDPSVLSGVELGVAPDEEGNLTIAVRAASGATAGEFVAALTASGFITVGGEWNPDSVIAGSDDFALTAFTGASDGGPPEMGRGATINEFDDRPIFDRGVDVDGTAPDSMQAMNEIVAGLGAFPYNVGTATKPDWGRSISMSRSDPAEWQWFKKFMSTVRGRQRTFWLPTFREDLLPAEGFETGPTWSVVAGAPAVQATLALEEPVTFSGALAGITIRARPIGALGNGIQFAMDTGTLSDTGELVENTGTSQLTVLFNDGDRVGDIVDLINAQSTLVEAIITGIYDPDAALTAGEDEFEFLDLEHGVNAIEASTTGTITIDNTYGDYPFWATDHSRLMIVQEEVPYYVRILSAVDNLDETTTLTVQTDGDAPDPAAIEMISWLELCRFENDDIAVEHRNATFTVKTTARVVQQ